MSSTQSPAAMSSGHAFVHPTIRDSRAPCPALNALANHGYLPRDGRSINHRTLVHALREVFNLSLPLALLLSFFAILFCGNGFQVDLSDLSAHGKIEHSGSLFHDDASRGAKYAPVSVDRTLLRKLLGHAAPGHGLVLADFARARAERDAALTRNLDRVHSEIARGESALAWLVMKNKRDEVPLTTASQFFGDERLPDGWTRPSESVGLRETHGWSSHVAMLVQKFRRG